MYARLFDALDAHLAAIEAIQSEARVDLTVRTLLQQSAESLRLRMEPDERFLEQFSARQEGAETVYRERLRKAQSRQARGNSARS